MISFAKRVIHCATLSACHFTLRLSKRHLTSMTIMDREILPISARPVHYNLLIDADLANFKFAGKVDIEQVFFVSPSLVCSSAHPLTRSCFFFSPSLCMSTI